MSDAAVQTLPMAPVHPPNGHHPTPIRLKQSLAAISADLMQQTSSVSRQVADDIVLWSTGRASRSPQNEYAKTMRRMVDQVLDKHSSLFRGLVNRTNTANTDLPASITAIADEEFGDGEANWGRIVALCAFVARLSRYFQENGMEENVEVLGGFLRSYFNDRLNAWIATQGGWVSIRVLVLLPNHVSLQNNLFYLHFRTSSLDVSSRIRV